MHFVGEAAYIGTSKEWKTGEEVLEIVECVYYDATEESFIYVLSGKANGGPQDSCQLENVRVRVSTKKLVSQSGVSFKVSCEGNFTPAVSGRSKGSKIRDVTGVESVAECENVCKKDSAC
eukprot:Platyproteum_vivax@DN7365_c0_g1_i3.p1